MRTLCCINILLVALATVATPARAAIATPAQRQDAQRFKHLSAAAHERTAKQLSTADHKAFFDFRSKTSQKWRVRYNSRTGAPASLTSGENLRYTGSPENAALRFFNENRALLKVDPAQLALADKKTALGITHLLYKQSVNGIPVETGNVKVHIDEKGDIVSFQSNFAPDASAVSLSPSVSASMAERAAVADAGGSVDGQSSLALWPSNDDGAVHLAWKIPVSARGTTPGRWFYFVDANTGSVLTRKSRRANVAARKLWSGGSASR